MTGPEAARRLLASVALRKLAPLAGGGQLFLTGGSLRDRLLGLPTRDLDLSVTGDPQAAAVALAELVGGRCFPLGRPPLATWRVAGGHPQVDVWGITGGLEQDIFRRDFTINALFWRLPRGPLLDLVGGLDDLAAGRIRVVRPENLFDDPLRVLRGVRLLATHPRLRLTSESELLLRGAARGLRTVAAERVCEEFRRLLAGPAVPRALSAAARLGILQLLVPAWEGYGHAGDVALLAGALQTLRRSGRGGLARGAREVAAALLAAPSAGFPGTWQPDPAATALAAIGWPARAARRAVEAAALGERLQILLSRDSSTARELAARAGELVEPAMAWVVARANLGGAPIGGAARAFLQWHRRFDARPALLNGDEVAELLGLAPGEARSEAVLALRAAQARGEARTRSQARRFLLSRTVR
ncbi:MAG: hypothetical protein LAO05_08685 [Acidobacteriia bacterium]|nr:hypothetical protein [Terriglobia bacterium]